MVDRPAHPNSSRHGGPSAVAEHAPQNAMDDPGEIERSIMINEDLIARADEYVSRGISHLIVGADGPDYELEPLRRMVTWRDSR